MKWHSKYLFIYIVFVSLQSIAQDAETDSLKSVINNRKDDSLKVDALNSLAIPNVISDPVAAIDYAIAARDVAIKINYKKGAAYAYKWLGIASFYEGKYLDAIDNSNKSLQVFESIGDKAGVSNLLSNIGAFYEDRDEDSKALEYYLKSLQIAEQINNKGRIASALSNIGVVYFKNPATNDKALEYFLKALPLALEIGDPETIGTIYSNIGEAYQVKNNYKQALYYYQQSIEAFDHSPSVAYTYNDIGKLYQQKKDFIEAKRNFIKGFEIASESNSLLDKAQSLLGIAQVYINQKDFEAGLKYYKTALPIVEKLKSISDLKHAYEGLSVVYAQMADFNNAYRYQALLTDLYNKENEKKLSFNTATFEYNIEIEKKQGQINLLKKDQALQKLELQKQKFTRDALIAGLLFVLIIALILLRNYRIKVKTNKLLDKQKEEIESLLLNILPAEVAKELQKKGYSTPRYYESVSVLFTDFKNFTKKAEALTPQQLVTELNEYFVAFDGIIEKYNLEKIKTIGDSYMCAGGLPSADADHPFKIMNAGLEIAGFIKLKNEKRTADGLPSWDLRIGIHIGPVVAGVVGRKKYAYDIWGSTVNIASRMESNGEPGQVNISEATYELIKDKYICDYRGKIFAKNIGAIDMYFVKCKREVEVGV